MSLSLEGWGSLGLSVISSTLLWLLLNDMGYVMTYLRAMACQGFSLVAVSGARKSREAPLQSSLLQPVFDQCGCPAGAMKEARPRWP